MFHVHGRKQRPRGKPLASVRGNRHAAPTFIEVLEPRTLLSAVVSPALDFASLTQVNPASGGGGGGGSSTILTPAQIRQAYGFNQITFQGSGGQTITGDGAGQTIAIVDAYDDPTIAADLQKFDQNFGLSNNDGQGQFVLTKTIMGSNVAANSDWSMETSLDVEWAHAIAPGAHILLVEAKTAGMNDLLSAVDYAASVSGVVSVSMSWGGGEFQGENTLDSNFTTPAGHIGGSSLPGGVTFVASAGDSGAPPEYPAASPNVLAVGGTELTLNSSGAYAGESGWSDGGGGISMYESKPSYQSGITLGGSKRTNPDVAYDADPNSGFYVYDSDYSGQGGWYDVGGTSAGSPQWSALIAIADQGRALEGLGSLNGAQQTLPTLYSLSSSDFHDVTSGNNGYNAGTGYDLVTGLGSPVANLVVASLDGVSTTTPTPPTPAPLPPPAPKPAPKKPAPPPPPPPPSKTRQSSKQDQNKNPRQSKFAIVGNASDPDAGTANLGGHSSNWAWLNGSYTLNDAGADNNAPNHRHGGEFIRSADRFHARGDGENRLSGGQPKISLASTKGLLVGW